MENTQELLDIWYNDLYLISHAHYEAAVYYQKMHRNFGIPITVLSAILGTSLFATINLNPDIWARIIAGLISFSVAVLSALNTYLNYIERAEKHRIAGSRFRSLLTEVELNQRLPINTEAEFRTWADDLRRRWDHLSLESVTVPPKIFEKHRKLHNYTKIAGEGREKR